MALPHPRILAVAAAWTAVALAPAGAAAAAPEAPPTDPQREIRAHRWIFAKEDTARIPAFFEMSEIEIRADRLKIGDIVQRCIEREEEIRERIESHEYTLLTKVVLSIGGSGENAKRRMIVEQADRKFFRRPHEERTIPLKVEKYRIENGERKEWDVEKDDDPSVDITYDDLDDLPFYLEERDDYDFEIRSREIVGDRVIYEVTLTPKSDFEIAPSGRIWVDTSTFSILREEFNFGDRVPLPLLIKSIGPYIRERERIGDVWVWKRMLIRVELRGGLLRWVDRDIPDVAEWQVLFRDHRVNEGWSIDDRIPDETGGPRRADGIPPELLEGSGG